MKHPTPLYTAVSHSWTDIAKLLIGEKADINVHNPSNGCNLLHMAASPDGTTIVTAAADETLRFWKVLSGPRAKDDAARANESVLGWTSIR